MMFVTLLTIRPEQNKEAYSAIKKFKLPKGVSVKTTLGLFGRYDGLLIYEAKDERTGMNFLLDICKIPGVTDTETMVATW